MRNSFVAVKGPSPQKPYYVIRLEHLRDGDYDFIKYEEKKSGVWHAKPVVVSHQPWDTLVWLHWGFQLTSTKRIPMRHIRAIACSNGAWPEMLRIFSESE